MSMSKTADSRTALFVMTLCFLQPVVNFASVNLRNHDLAAPRVLFYFFVPYGLAWAVIAIAARFQTGINPARVALLVGGSFWLLFNEFLLLAWWGEWYPASSLLFRALYVLEAAILMAWWVSTRRVARSSAALSVLLIFLATVVVWDAGHIIAILANGTKPAQTGELRPPSVPSLRPTKARDRVSPNVYFFLPDSHVGEVASRELSLYTGVFDALREREFRVIPDAVANASVTTYSMAHLFSMSLVLEEEERLTHAFTNRLARLSLSEQSPVIRGFRERHYDFVWIYDGYDGPPCPPNADRCIQKQSVWTKQDVVFIGRSPLVRLLKFAKLPYFDLPLPLLMYPNRLEVREMFDYLPDPADGPYFLFSHLSLPHPPYRFDRDCGHASLPYGDEAFRAQFQCTARLLTELVDHIQARDPSAIIILQSDTGEIFESVYPAGPSILGWPEASLRARFNILSAFYAPGSCKAQLRSGLSPVNTFRWLFACLDGDTPRLIEDRSWVTRYLSDQPGGEFVEWRGSLSY